LRLTLDALVANEDARRTDVTIICDGPQNPHDASLCQQVYEEARRPRPFGALEICRRETNFGLARSILHGVSEALARRDRVIVLEDDIVTSPAFLTFMNDALERYSADHRVISIHGYSYPTEIEQPFFLRGADCWGWATWRRGWQLFDPDGTSLLAHLRRRSLTDAFDFSGSYPYTRMLEDQIAGRNESWAIRWCASAFLADKLTLYPGRSLVRNIGNDGSGTHAGATDRFDGELALQPPNLSGLAVEESSAARLAFERYFRGRNGRDRIMSRVLWLINIVRGRARKAVTE
jgi:hypothetical protein